MGRIRNYKDVIIIVYLHEEDNRSLVSLYKRMDGVVCHWDRTGPLFVWDIPPPGVSSLVEPLFHTVQMEINTESLP